MTYSAKLSLEMKVSGAVALLATVALLGNSAAADLFPLSIIHINDFHARFEATNQFGGNCDTGSTCIGGYARTVHTVKRLLDEHKDHNPVYFNAGDSFQGTLWYNVGRWNVTSQFLNMLPADAMTLGNHEFDHSIEGLVPFLERINTTMLVANMDTSEEPTLNGLYQKSMIIERSGRKIGVIGVILETTYNLANTGKVMFSNESDAIREEAQILKAQGANIIIVISHCGYDVDKVIAMQAGADIDVIVGAHSHTFLYTGTPPGPDTPRGEYPTEIIHASGHRVLIVQASAYAKYVGNLRVYFDDNGDVVSWEGAPIYMSSDVPEDPEVLVMLEPWKEMIDKVGNEVIGETIVPLLKEPCGGVECNLGNFFSDAMAAMAQPYRTVAWTAASIGVINVGALRVPLSRGNITFSALVTMSPFENILHAFSLTGIHLKEALEYAVSPIDLEKNVTSSWFNLQFSGLRVTYNYTNPVGSRVVKLQIRCNTCRIPKYEKFNEKYTYRIVAPSFLQEGGDGFTMFRDYARKIMPLVSDIDALLAYVRATTPIFTGLEGRITVLK